MTLTEARLKKIIRERIKKILLEREERDSTRRERGRERRQASREPESYSGPLVTVDGDKKYLGDRGTGMSPEGFWDRFRIELQEHVNTVYPDIGLRIENLGVSRDLAKAADPGGNTARVAGSKHGAGLAQDVYLHTDKYGEYTSFRNDNPALAEDQQLVDAILEFMEGYPQLRWGGTFGRAGLRQGQLPRGRGILEFHHFEYKDSHMPRMFEPHKEELAKVPGNHSPAGLKNTRALGRLYTSLVQESGMKIKISKASLRKILLEELERDRAISELKSLIKETFILSERRPESLGGFGVEMSTSDFERAITRNPMGPANYPDDIKDALDDLGSNPSKGRLSQMFQNAISGAGTDEGAAWAALWAAGGADGDPGLQGSEANILADIEDDFSGAEEKVARFLATGDRRDVYDIENNRWLDPEPEPEEEEEEEEETEEEEGEGEAEEEEEEASRGDSTVRRIQQIVYGRESGMRIDGRMGPHTRRKFNRYVRDNWDESHGDRAMRAAISGKGWETASEYFNDATGLNLGSGNRGMLEFLEWMMDPEPEAEQGHVPGDARREMGSGREERLTTVSRGERGEDDLEVTIDGEEETLEDYSRRREKVHILVPASGEAMSIPGFTREIARIKIVFHDRGSLRDSLRDRNIKKVKVNRSLFRVVQQRKLDAIKDMVLNGRLVANYQGSDEGQE